ncbi:MAG: branched-chain amino acid ABC transporter permease [Actinobacteria bacterium]|nr:branched-chain amino acid ABC transporter permease [Actinomycetota bacterium]
MLSRRPLAMGVVGLIVLAVIALVAPQVLGSLYWYAVLTTVLINVLLTSSLRVIHLLGRDSLGHVGFMLIGAYSAALLGTRLAVPFWAGILAGGILAALLALAVSYSFMRVKGVYFAMLTLLTAETLRLAAYYWPSLTGGATGMVGIGVPGEFAGMSFGTPTNYYFVVVAVVTASLVVLFVFEHSDVGLKWRAVRDAEELATAVGVRTVGYKAGAFVLACFFAGVAGALFAQSERALSAEFTARFGVLMSLYLIVYMAVGGVERFAGAIAGAVVLTLLAELAGSFKEYQPIVLGAIAILVAVTMPTGLIGAFDRLLRVVRARRRPVSDAVTTKV